MISKYYLFAIGCAAMSLSAKGLAGGSSNSHATYQKCFYRLSHAPKDSTAPIWQSKTVLASQSCPPSWTIVSDKGRNPAGVYIYLYSTFY
ncbi:hypothetical protein [Pseudoalteromonas luteoviolacea]|uniref:hypothetical protein n=1 Tax=Pseudoalteromonas luteoviolacea TaxID=43657 RepID=UPI00114E7CF2|nr:hypothetical protein [Pseudoalteromonas luteoviolacea]TQF70942.1 hypothetical protein FLM44_07600 [Pseudoalteromonas luteoviolacea]